MKSNYPIYTRYFLPFTGVAWLLFLSFASSGIDFIRAKQKKLLLFAFLSATCFLWVGLGGVTFAQDFSKLRFPPENFTRLHSVFRTLDENSSQIVVISLYRWGATTVRFYQNYLRTYGASISLIEAIQRPADLRKVWQPLKENQSALKTYLFSSARDCLYNSDKISKVWNGKADFTEFCLFEIPSELSLTEIEDLIRNIRTDSVIKK